MRALKISRLIKQKLGWLQLKSGTGKSHILIVCLFWHFFVNDYFSGLLGKQQIMTFLYTIFSVCIKVMELKHVMLSFYAE
jgi:uncharacterized membrane protein